MPFDAQALINATVPSDRPRRVHFLLHALTLENMDAIQSRASHTPAGLAPLLANASRARWDSLGLLFVPTKEALGAFIVTGGFFPSEITVADSKTMLAHGNCEHRVMDNLGELPQPLRIDCPFEELLLSPLLKPAPLEMSRAQFSYSVSFKPGSGYEKPADPKKPPVLLNVFVVGRIEVGGLA